MSRHVYVFNFIHLFLILGACSRFQLCIPGEYSSSGNFDLVSFCKEMTLFHSISRFLV